MQIVNGIGVGDGCVSPADTKRRHPLIHRAEDVLGLFTHRVRRCIAKPDDPVFILAVSFRCFP